MNLSDDSADGHARKKVPKLLSEVEQALASGHGSPREDLGGGRGDTQQGGA